MATQYRDGTFGETKPLPEAMEEFLNAVEAGEAKAFHIGTEQEIEEVKNREALQDQINALESRVYDLQRAADPNGIKVYPATVLDELENKL